MNGSEIGITDKTEAIKEGLLKWGRQSRVDSNLIRVQSPNIGLDASKMVLGHVLRTITGDDGNSFVYLHTLIHDEIFLRGGQQNAIDRLAWEIELPETPEDLKEKLEKVKEDITGSDWTNKESFEVSKASWQKMKTELVDTCETDEVLKEALDYYDINYRKIVYPQE